jgi:flagellar basal body-associated protein FliL
MTEYEKDHKDSMEVSLVQMVIWLVALMSASFFFLYEAKLDKSAFGEHQKAVESMSADIREIRGLLERRAAQLENSGSR